MFNVGIEESIYLPEEWEPHLTFVDDEVAELPEEFEAGLVDLFGRVLQRFKGQQGFWVTTRTGRRVFIRAEKTGRIQVDPSVAKEDLTKVVSLIRQIPTKVRREIKAFVITTKSGGTDFGTYNSLTKTMTIDVQNFNRLSGPKGLISLKTIIDHESGHAVFDALPLATRKAFADVSVTDGGVTPYAMKYFARWEVLRDMQDAPVHPEVARLFYANENFAEMYQLSRSEGDMRVVWDLAQSTNSVSTKRFKRIMEEFGVSVT